MNKKFLYLFIFLLTAFFSKEALSSTDILCNVLAQTNGYIKKAGEVQNLISGQIRQITTMKISPDALLGAIGGGDLLGEAEKLQEKAENLKEKAERIKAFAEDAKERKAELMAKYERYSKMAKETMAKAQAAYEKGMALRKEYMDKFNNAVNTYNSIKDEVTAGIEAGKNIVGEVKGTMQDIAGEEDNADTKDTRVVTMAEGTKNQTPIIVEEDGYNDITPYTLGQNQATAISTVSRMAENASVIENSDFIVPDEDVLKKSEVSLTPEEVISNAASADTKENSMEEEIKTKTDMTDQLVGNTNKKAENNAGVPLVSSGEDISDNTNSIFESLSVKKGSSSSSNVGNSLSATRSSFSGGSKAVSIKGTDKDKSAKVKSTGGSGSSAAGSSGSSGSSGTAGGTSGTVGSSDSGSEMSGGSISADTKASISDIQTPVSEKDKEKFVIIMGEQKDLPNNFVASKVVYTVIKEAKEVKTTKSSTIEAVLETKQIKLIKEGLKDKEDKILPPVSEVGDVKMWIGSEKQYKALKTKEEKTIYCVQKEVDTINVKALIGDKLNNPKTQEKESSNVE